MINLNLDMTTLASSAITAMINGIAVFAAIRYAGKLFDAIEKKEIIHKHHKNKTEDNNNVN